MLFPVFLWYSECFENLLNGLRIIAVEYFSAVIKDNQRHDISMKVIMPFMIPAILFLNVPQFKGDRAYGEKTFRLGAVASAISDKYHNSIVRRIEQLWAAWLDCLCMSTAEKQCHNNNKVIYDALRKHCCTIKQNMPLVISTSVNILKGGELSCSWIFNKFVAL